MRTGETENRRLGDKENSDCCFIRCATSITPTGTKALVAGPHLGATTGGDRPLSGGQTPLTGGDRPLSGGQTPLCGGDRPLSGGDRPLSGGDRPLSGGDRPLCGGEHPLRGGQTPLCGDRTPQCDGGHKKRPEISPGRLNIFRENLFQSSRLWKSWFLNG
jgi:hypothetical protein